MFFFSEWVLMYANNKKKKLNLAHFNPDRLISITLNSFSSNKKIT